jgi:hypothetical protein
MAPNGRMADESGTIWESGHALHALGETKKNHET